MEFEIVSMKQRPRAKVQISIYTNNLVSCHITSNENLGAREIVEDLIGIIEFSDEITQQTIQSGCTEVVVIDTNENIDIVLLKQLLRSEIPTFSFLSVYYRNPDAKVKYIDIAREKRIVIIVLCLQKKAKKFIPKPLIKRILEFAFLL